MSSNMDTNALSHNLFWTYGEKYDMTVKNIRQNFSGSLF